MVATPARWRIATWLRSPADPDGLARLGLAAADVRGDRGQRVRTLALAAGTPRHLVEPRDVLANATDLPVPVEESDGRDLHVVVRYDEEPLARREALPLLGCDPRDGRAIHRYRTEPLEPRVRQRAVAFCVDVLRLLEVRGHDHHELQSLDKRE